jgi:hypothetical protein
MLRFLWRVSFFVFGLGLLLSLIWIVLLLVEKQPGVAPAPAPTVASVGRAERLLREIDPRRLRQGQLKTVTLKESDVNVALSHLLARPEITRKLHTGIDFTEHGANVRASYELPANPIGNFFNLSFTVIPQDPGLGLSEVRLGRLPLPDWMTRKALGLLNDAALKREQYRDVTAALGAVEKFSLTDNTASLAFRWDRALALRLGEHGRNLLLPAADRERLAAYRAEINQLLNAQTKPSRSLLEVFKPVMSFAASRSRDTSTAEAIAENQAALLALALTAVGRPQAWTHLLGEQAQSAPQLRRVRLTLQGRDDLPKHLLVSAALTGAADTVVADVIGVYKEVQDSDGGSGFSFVDLVADRAGVRLAEKAMQSPLDLQQAVASLNAEGELFPPTQDLAEGMQAADFKRRYTTRESAQYRAVIASIEQRLDRLALYR